MSKLLKYYGSTASFSNQYSLNFDGADEHALHPSWAGVHLTGADPFFIGFWAKFDSVSGNAYLASCANLVGAEAGWAVLRIGQKMRWTMANAARTRFQIVETTSDILSTGAWNHYAIRRTSNTGAGITIYQDGTSQATTILTNTLNTSDTASYEQFTVAASRTATLPFDGKIANLGVFNVAGTTSTPGELTTLKMGDLRTCSIGANLQGAWHFPNGTSDYPDWVDYSGGGRNLVMTNQESADINTDIPT